MELDLTLGAITAGSVNDEEPVLPALFMFIVASYHGVKGCIFLDEKSSQTDAYIPYTVILTLLLTRNKNISRKKCMFSYKLLGKVDKQK